MLDRHSSGDLEPRCSCDVFISADANEYRPSARAAVPSNLGSCRTSRLGLSVIHTGLNDAILRKGPCRFVRGRGESPHRGRRDACHTAGIPLYCQYSAVPSDSTLAVPGLRSQYRLRGTLSGRANLCDLQTATDPVNAALIATLQRNSGLGWLVSRAQRTTNLQTCGLCDVPIPSATAPYYVMLARNAS